LEIVKSSGEVVRFSRGGSSPKCVRTNSRILHKYISEILIVISVISVVLALVYFPSWIKYRQGIKLLKNGRVVEVAALHGRIIFKLTDNKVIEVKNPPIFIYNTNLAGEFMKCGVPCKNTKFLME